MDRCSPRLTLIKTQVVARQAGQVVPRAPVEAGRFGWAMVMSKNPVLDVPLSSVIRPDIALPLEQIMKICTVGSLLRAWRSPKNQRSIEQLFDSPEQARHALQVCAAWLGFESQASHTVVAAWWTGDERSGAATPAQ